MSVSPGRRKSSGFCHIHRQGNRLAQKQIICPIYRGSEGSEPYRMGPESEILAGRAPPDPIQTLRSHSFLDETESGGFADSFRELAEGPPPPVLRHRAQKRIERARNSLYSAAAASEVFGLAAEIMKSEMRGTISDLNLEPLNTP